MWTFTDICCALVDYVVQDLRDGTYKLNWGVVAIAQNSPRAIVRPTLKNVKNNKSKQDYCSYGRNNSTLDFTC